MSANGEVAQPEVDLEAARAEALAKAHEKGWNEPVPFDYSGPQATATDVEQAGEGDGQRISEPAWLADAAVYEWDDSYGEVGPVNTALERELYYDANIMRAGGAIQALTFDITLEGPVHIAPVREFDEAGLHPVMLENVRLCQYQQPTPIQSYTIPAVLLGHDVVGCAQTGSGKTAAYLIPILSKLMGKAKLLAGPRSNRGGARVRAEPLVLVVVPTRELACQIFDEARRLCYRTMLRPCVVYGGAPMKSQREQLELGCDVLIATPGRLCDFLRNMSLLSLHRLKFTVIDEADEMLADGWEEAMTQIMGGGDANVDDDHIYMMFSATFPKEARELARQYMAKDHIRVRVGRVGSTHANIKQNIVEVTPTTKNDALYDLIFAGKPCRTLVFVNSKPAADRVDDFLYNKGLPSTSIHSDRTQREREDALRAFKLGKSPILVATGVTARGLDISNVMHVINYDLPSMMHGGIEEYVHRIGRTARIGNEGVATSFYDPDRNEEIADALVKILVESKQEVPDFWQDRIPQELTWEDDASDKENDEGVAGDSTEVGGGDWGAGATAADTNIKADGGFQADTEGATW